MAQKHLDHAWWIPLCDSVLAHQWYRQWPKSAEPQACSVRPSRAWSSLKRRCRGSFSWSKWHEAVDFDVDHGFRKQPLNPTPLCCFWLVGPPIQQQTDGDKVDSLQWRTLPFLCCKSQPMSHANERVWDFRLVLQQNTTRRRLRSIRPGLRV